jgi:hypothetical protein
MNAVGVKAPAIHLGDLIRTLVQHQNTESVTIKRKKSEGRKGTTGRFHDLRSHRFMNGNIVSTLFSCDLSDDCAVLFDAPVEFALERGLQTKELLRSEATSRAQQQPRSLPSRGGRYPEGSRETIWAMARLEDASRFERNA